MADISRRKLFTLLAAPAIVRATSLMALSPLPLLDAPPLDHAADAFRYMQQALTYTESGTFSRYSGFDFLAQNIRANNAMLQQLKDYRYYG